MKVDFIVPGKPKGKGRPRIAYVGDSEETQYKSSGFSGRISAEAFRAMQNDKKTKPKGHAYTPADTLEYENLVKSIYSYQVKKKFPDNIPLFIVVKAYFPIPKSTSKKDRALMLSGEKRPTVKPDGDNILKIICDGLNEIAFSDDKLLIGKYVEKWYSDNPRVEVSLSDKPLVSTVKRFKIKYKRKALSNNVA